MPTADYSSYHQNTGTTSDGAKFNNLIDAIQTTVNALDNNNIAAGAAIAFSKLAATPSARAKSTVAQSITNNLLTTVTLSGTDWLNGGTTIVGSSIAVPVAGIYLVNGIVAWSNGSTAGSMRYLVLNRQNSIAVLQEAHDHYQPPTQAGFFTAYTVTALMAASANDNFYMNCQQDSGGALNLNNAWLSVTRVG